MDNKHNSYNAPGNGFLMGVIVGGIATLLFSTKKGREIVREIVDIGIEKYSDLQKNINDAVELEEVVEDDYVEPESRPSLPESIESPQAVVTPKKKEEKKTSTSSNGAVKSTQRRFFKSTKKS